MTPGTGFTGLEHEYFKILQSISSYNKRGQCPTFVNIDSWLFGNCQYGRVPVPFLLRKTPVKNNSKIPPKNQNFGFTSRLAVFKLHFRLNKNT
jgi:hypothetical protein